MSEAFERATVGDIVATDFRTAAILEQFGIDFCCGGRRSLAEACRAALVAASDVETALNALPPTGDPDADVRKWPLDRLIDHIVSKHHSYVRWSMPAIRRHLAKLVEAHAGRHPELVLILGYFDTIAPDLLQHLRKEEQILFPYICELQANAATCERGVSPFGAVENPIRMMEREHRDAADALQAVRRLTDDYAAPADGCATYQVCMAELAQFERDLHQHVHLENNVLFPKAIAMEHRLQAARANGEARRARSRGQARASSKPTRRRPRTRTRAV